MRRFAHNHQKSKDTVFLIVDECTYYFVLPENCMLPRGFDCFRRSRLSSQSNNVILINGTTQLSVSETKKLIFLLGFFLIFCSAHLAHFRIKNSINVNFQSPFNNQKCTHGTYFEIIRRGYFGMDFDYISLFLWIFQVLVVDQSMCFYNSEKLDAIVL